MVAKDSPAPARRRTAKRLRAVSVALGSWALAAVFVRLVLDWSDSQPYAGETTEARYVLWAVIAVVIAVSGTLVALVLWLRSRGEVRGEVRGELEANEGQHPPL